MINSLEKGIRIEDLNIILEWGQPIDKVFNKFNGRKEVKGDRTIYHWGKHQILNGLELHLTNSYWNFGKEKRNRDFNSIEYWAIGDESALKYFDRISKHLVSQFGNPNVMDESDLPERSWIWNLGNIRLHLFFFEQHAYKLHFTIEKES